VSLIIHLQISVASFLFMLVFLDALAGISHLGKVNSYAHGLITNGAMV